MGVFYPKRKQLVGMLWSLDAWTRILQGGAEELPEVTGAVSGVRACLWT